MYMYEALKGDLMIDRGWQIQRTLQTSRIPSISSLVKILTVRSLTASQAEIP